jgi:hypothetical protein
MRHDFRDWCQTLDWIVQTLVGEVPLMDGHRDNQSEVSSPGLVFLRGIALAADRAELLDQWLTASRLYDLAQESRLLVPGLRTNQGESAVMQVGRVLSPLFIGRAELVVDSFAVIRSEQQVGRVDGGGSFPVVVYRVTRSS